jgi:hypothetical protein
MKPFRIRTDVASTAALILCFGALAACDPEPPCWKDVQTGTTYRVSLASKASPAPYAVGLPDIPSCTGIDSLAAGMVLDIAIAKDSTHAEYARAQCWVPEGVITSDVGLTLVPVDGLAGFDIGFGAGPMFVSSARFSIGDCMGSWSFMAVDSTADAHNGTAAHRWAGRLAWLDATPACQTAFPAIATASTTSCYDEWDIDVQAM